MFDDKKLEDDSLKKLLMQVQQKIAMMHDDKEEGSDLEESLESPEEEEKEMESPEDDMDDMKSFLEGRQDPEDPIKPKTLMGGKGPSVSVAIDLAKKKPYKR